MMAHHAHRHGDMRSCQCHSEGAGVPLTEWPRRARRLRSPAVGLQVLPLAAGAQWRLGDCGPLGH